jgi:chemotaxis protein MotB
MKPKNPQGATNQRDRWMVSYVDVLSILLIFFMLAAAKSLPAPQAQTQKVVPAPPPSEAQAEEVQPTPPPVQEEAAQTAENTVPEPPPAQPAPAAEPAPPPRANLLHAQELLKEQGLEPKLEARGLVISVPQVILFPSGGDTVNPQAMPTIAQIADVLRGIPNDVRLVGHADTVPVHNRRFRSNWDLSVARSEKILELLSIRYGIAESRLSIASYGPWRPAAPNDTVDGRASNRRVEIVILDESDSEGPQAE